MQNKSINGFTLQRLLGTGGMAEVWYAESKIGMKAAVKILNEKLSHDDQMQERFLNEAKVMVQLDHPNIRKVYGFDEIDGRPAIVMEYLDGSDLKTRMKQGQRFTQEELVKWWDQLVDALNYTHAQNIVHRDIKPSNIFIDQKGNAKLLDFGIAKVADTTTGTQTGSTLGTRIYMSPEQVRDPKRVGTASDVYSLAVTFVHLLTGKTPYDSSTDSDYDIQVSIVTKPVDMSKVPTGWQGFLAPYLAKNPEDRPALSPFKAVVSEAPVKTDESDDEGTIVGDAPNNPEHPNRQRVTPPAASRHSGPKDKPQSKKALWIGLGIAAAVIVALVLLLKPKQEPIPTDPDTQAYEACQTVQDFRNYISHYGVNAVHYVEAKDFVECYVADSLQKMQDSLAYLAKQKAEVGRTCVTGSINGHNYVDLDLPSGMLWATCNVGANKPEGIGNYYAWGETRTKKIYNWETYKYANGKEDRLTKYCSNPDYGNNGFTDNLGTLQAADDAASINWGGSWRIPTKEEWQELLDNTSNHWVKQNGVNGRLFIAKNGRTLFLPSTGAAGNELSKKFGHYWSSSLHNDPIYNYPYCSFHLDFGSDECRMYAAYYRTKGFSVRPVREK